MANEINLTQPAVSQMVKDLEFAFGTNLLVRSVRGISLSAERRLALQRTRAGRATFDHLAAQLDTALPPVQRVGTNPAVMFQLLPLALQHPDIAGSTMRYTICSGLTGTMTRALWDGVLDCYVGRIHWDEVPPQIAGALCHVPLMTTDLVVACARTHPLARKSRLRISDLAGWDWALPPGNSKNRIALEAGLRNNGLPHANATFEIAADPNALMILVREMELLTILPRLALDRAVAADLCALGLVDLRMPAMQIGFFTLAEHAQMPALQNLRQALAEAAQAVTSA